MLAELFTMGILGGVIGASTGTGVVIADGQPTLIKTKNPSKVPPKKVARFKCSCGADCTSDQKFCGKCGADVSAQAASFCPTCGGTNPVGAKYCVNCGKELPGVTPATYKFCKDCGAPIRPGESFCVKCGAPAMIPHEAPADSAVQEAPADSAAPATPAAPAAPANTQAKRNK